MPDLQPESPTVTQFNDRTSALSLLLTRRSGKPRDMIAPGPSESELATILQAAQRVPDHGKLAPWRFVVVDNAARQKLADVIETAFRAEKPAAPQTDIDSVRAYALQGERLVVILSTPKTGIKIPLWEQELSAGAVCQNFLLATHDCGFLGSWLTGWPAYSPAVLAALGGSETNKIAGFMYIGSAARPLEERPRPNYDDVVSVYR
jgi:nitroreductase